MDIENESSPERNLFKNLALAALGLSCSFHCASGAGFDWRERFDFDGDGRNDYISFSYSGGAHCCYDISLKLTGFAGTHHFPFKLDGGYPKGLDLSLPANFSVEDFDGDGKPEIFMRIFSYNGRDQAIPERIKKRYKLSTNYVIVEFEAGKINVWSFPRHISTKQYFFVRNRDTASNIRVRRKGQRFGYIDEKGVYVILPALALANPFHNGVALVRIHTRGNTYFINSKGRVLAEISEQVFFPVQKFSQNGLILARKDARLLFMNKTGRAMIRGKFLDGREFSEGLAAVQVAGGKWGYITSTGAWQIKPRYETAFSFEGSTALVTENGRQFRVDKYGRAVKR